MSAVRTYDRDTYRRLVEAWSSFGHEWTAARQTCALAGYPFPPSGSPTDDRDDEEPSQRAIVWHALDYRPLVTLDIIRRSRSWSEVVGRILAQESRLREDADLRARDDAWERSFEPTNHESTQILADILQRIRDSDPRDAA